MLRPPAALTRVPGAGPGLLGVASLRGAVAPVYDLGLLLGATVPSERRRLVLVERLGPVALAVEAVDGLQDGLADGEPLDLDDLLPRPASAAAREPAGPDVAAAGSSTAETMPLASFRVGDRRYAVALQRLVDVIDLAGRPDQGELAWRGARLPLVTGPALLAGAERTSAEPPTRALVVERPQGLTALAVEAVGEVLRTPAEALQPAPRALRGAAASHVFATGDGGVVALLDADRLLEDTPAVRAVAGPAPSEVPEGEAARLVVFGIGRRRFAVPAGAVEAAAPRLQRLTRVPGAPAAVRGVLDRRGRTTPVLELARGGRWTLLLNLGGASLGLDVTEPPRSVRGTVEGPAGLEAAGAFGGAVRLGDGAVAPVLARTAPPSLVALAEALQAPAP